MQYLSFTFSCLALHDNLEFIQIVIIYESVTVNALTLVKPKEHKFFRLLKYDWCGHQQALEHVGQMADVKLVVEVCCCFAECLADLNHEQKSE